MLDFNEIKLKAEAYKKDMSGFLRDMISIPSESGDEKKVVLRIKEEMQKVGFDKIKIDEMGNIHGTIGTGKRIIAYDAHIDTVGIGNIANWKYDPYKGYEDDNIIVGRGASDQEGGMASMVYAGKIIKDLGLQDDYTLVMVGSVQEEDCDGLCWQYIIKELGLKPEFVVSTEPTDGGVYRGQRGRMEIKVSTSGISAHGSAPERGDNAIFKMAPILIELQELHTKLTEDKFLGKGSLTVSEIFFSSPSRCAVADECSISIDRRLTKGEDKELALSQIKSLASVKKAGANVELYKYQKPSYTGFVYPTECYFPSWVTEKNNKACEAVVKTYKNLFNKDPKIDKWTFSTNGVSITGMFGIPTIGFGPGKEAEAHAPNEKTWKENLVTCAAVYAALPIIYVTDSD
ncbi:MAG: YgeY family selenium metabolism-linked hydrolase [Deltaproteobacteria bacterium]|nr:YgeY family selenium metabolism-linked hydrolase [Deltaproteobacteria bacterium]